MTYPEPPFKKLNEFLDTNDFVLAVILTGTSFIQLFFFDSLVIQGQWLLLYSLLLVLMILVYLTLLLHTVLRILIGHRKAKLSDVFFFVLSYALFIVVFALCYGCLYQYSLASGSPIFRTALDELHAIDFLYFSGVVMTTLGFGDIVPVTGFAKILTVFEASLGQILLVLSIGSVIGRMQNSATSHK